MNKKKTKDLENVLMNTHIRDFDHYCEANKDIMMMEENAFSTYMKDLIKKKGNLLQTVFLKSDIPERYGYKLLSGEKRTKQRDIILRICYAAEFDLEETQNALKIYEMPELYAKIPRDALLMIIFNEHPGSVLEVNEIMMEKGFLPLRTSGLQD